MNILPRRIYLKRFAIKISERKENNFWCKFIILLYCFNTKYIFAIFFNPCETRFLLFIHGPITLFYFELYWSLWRPIERMVNSETQYIDLGNSHNISIACCIKKKWVRKFREEVEIFTAVKFFCHHIFSSLHNNIFKRNNIAIIFFLKISFFNDIIKSLNMFFVAKMWFN